MKFLKWRALVILLFLGNLAMAQSHRFEIGLEGGPNLASLRGNDALKSHHHAIVGSSVGLLFQYNFSEVFSVHSGLGYERKGTLFSELQYDNNGIALGEYEERMHFNYFNVPLLLQATLERKIQYFVNAGPYMGYLNRVVDIASGYQLPETKTYTTNLYKQVDLGLSTGIGLAVPIKQKFALAFEIRNNLGLVNISKFQVVNNGSIKTNATNFLFSFSYRFGENK